MAKEFEQNALADNDVVSGQIDIGCFETVAPLYLPQLIAGFSALYPGVKIRIRDGEQQELVQGLTSGTFDLAILYEHDLDATIQKLDPAGNVVQTGSGTATASRFVIPDF